MEGRPELAFGATGSLIADQVRMYLRELDGDSAVGVAVPGGGANSKNHSHPAPDRLIAIGGVQITSPHISGRTQRLDANFHLEPAASAANGGKSPGNGPLGGGNAGPGNAPQSSYQAVADGMRLEVVMRGQQATPTTLICDGNVALRETPQSATDQKPIEVRGNQLFVDQLETNAPHVVLKGASSNGGNSGELAQIGGRGMTLLTSAFEMVGRENRGWSNGPGDATIIMSHDLQGNASATPTPVKIHWEGGLKFDGQIITFDRNVVVTDADSTLHCDQMLAKLAAPIQFGQKVEQTATNVSQIDCQGQVTIENVTRNTEGLTSHNRMQLGHLSINQQTGVVHGEGPGVIRSTRFGTAMGPFGQAAGATQPAASLAPGASGSKLHFMRIDFHSGMDGNMYTHELTFHDRVRVVYGPVDSWEQELDLARPETLPPESMKLTSDELRVNEDPMGSRTPKNPNGPGGHPMGYIQMQSKGDVRIEGQTPSQGEFRIQADRASYEEMKDAFILEGDTRTPAKLWRRTQAGGDAPPLEARRIYFSRSNNEAKVDGIQSLIIMPNDVKKLQAPTSGLPTR
jgi:hypothetical protein